MLIQFRQELTGTGFLVEENLAVDMPLRTAFINEYIKSMFQRQRTSLSRVSNPVAMKTQMDATLFENEYDVHYDEAYEKQEPLLYFVADRKRFTVMTSFDFGKSEGKKTIVYVGT